MDFSNVRPSSEQMSKGERSGQVSAHRHLWLQTNGKSMENSLCLSLQKLEKLLLFIYCFLLV